MPDLLASYSLESTVWGLGMEHVTYGSGFRYAACHFCLLHIVYGLRLGMEHATFRDTL